MDEKATQEELSWTAPEFIEHEKSASWYGLLAVAALILSGLTYLLTRDIISTAVVALALGCLGAYGARKPRELDYHLDASGLSVGNKHFDLENFKSFALVQEGDAQSIVFLPLRRFASLITIYCKPDIEDKIVNMLATNLPISVRNPDTIDKLMHKIRF